jgi:hypothetical protein
MKGATSSFGPPGAIEARWVLRLTSGRKADGTGTINNKQLFYLLLFGWSSCDTS